MRLKRVIAVFFLFLGLSAYAVSNKNTSNATTNRTIDETALRNQMMKNGYKWLGTPYKIKSDSKNGIDCSAFENRLYEGTGLRGITGKGRMTTSTMRSSGLSKNLSASQLKVGDRILMKPKSGGKYGHVMMYYGPGSNGKIKIIDAAGGNIGKVSVREIPFPPSRYAGVISVTDIIKANGYTPVNSDGTVVAPPIPEGKEINSISDITKAREGEDTVGKAKTNVTDIDFDVILESFQKEIDKGLERLQGGTLAILGILAVIELLMAGVRYLSGNVSEALKTLIRLGIKMSFLGYLITNAKQVIGWGFEIFSNIAEKFSGQSLSVDNVAKSVLKEQMAIIDIINKGDWSFWNLVWDSGAYFLRMGKAVFLIISLLILCYFLIKLVFEMFSAILEFNLSLGLSWIFLPFEVNSISKQYLGNKSITVFFIAGTKLVVLAMYVGVLFNALQKVGVTDKVSIDQLDMVAITNYMIVGLVVAFLLEKMNSAVNQLGR